MKTKIIIVRALRTHLVATAIILARIAICFGQTGGTLQLDSYPLTASEASGTVTFGVWRTAGTNSVTVNFATSDGTARAGLDYVSGSGTLTFGPGETRKTITITILDDGQTEPDETFNLTVSNPTGDAVLGAQTNIIFTILDDERPGGLDNSFARIGCDCFLNQLTVLPNGKMLVVDLYGALRWFNVDGSRDDASYSPVIQPTAIATQRDGRILVGGKFTDIGGIPRPGIARLNADGSLDGAFDPGSGISPLTFDDCCGGQFDPDPLSLGSSIVVLRVQTDGKILVGGGFTNVAGFKRNGLARLNQDGSLDRSFAPSLQGDRSGDRLVSSLVIQPDGKLLLSGSFEKVDGIQRNGLARLNLDGTLDLGFQSVLSDYPLKLLALQSDGKALIYVENEQNEPRRGHIMRLDSNGETDRTFDIRIEGLSDWGGFEVLVTATAIQDDGKILIGGYFQGVNGVHRDGIARLRADGTLDTSFSPPAAEPPPASTRNVTSMLAQPDGGVLVSTYHNIVRLIGDGRRIEFSSSAYSFSENAGSAVLTVRRVGDKSIAAQVNYETRDGIAGAGTDYLSQKGSLEFAPFEVSKNISIPILDNGRVQNDDRKFQVILTNLAPGSDFGTLQNTEVRILDEERPGSYDPDLQPPPELSDSFGWVSRQPDGALLTMSSTVEGVSRVTRFNRAGSEGFNLQVRNIGIRSVAIQKDGKFVVGGFFNEIGAVPRRFLARFESNGTLDLTYNPGATVNIGYGVSSVLLQGDGKLLVGGFAEAGGVMLARINTDGSRDTSYNSNLGNPMPGGSGIWSMAMQPDGKLVAVGYFTTVGGLSRNAIARFNTDGSVDTTFDPGTGALSQYNGEVRPNARSLLILNDGKILIAGGFQYFNSVRRPGIARLNANGSLDSTFDPLLTRISDTVDVEQPWITPDGKFLINGSFDAVNGVPRARIARLYSDGSLDTAFVAPPGANWLIALLPNGKALAQLTEFVNGAAYFKPVFLNGDEKYLSLTAPKVMPTGFLQVNLTTQPNATYILETSLNLLDWMPFKTNSATTFTLEFADPDSSKFAKRFYRARIR